MATSMTKVLCIYVLALSLFLCNMEARESGFFNKEPAYDNSNGQSNTAGYGEGYATSSEPAVKPPSVYGSPHPPDGSYGWPYPPGGNGGYGPPGSKAGYGQGGK